MYNDFRKIQIKTKHAFQQSNCVTIYNSHAYEYYIQLRKSVEFSKSVQNTGKI